MAKLKEFKRNLSCVFDDNLHTKIWQNIVDWMIIGLIVISSLEVFLSTFEGIAADYGGILHFVDIFGQKKTGGSRNWIFSGIGATEQAGFTNRVFDL